MSYNSEQDDFWDIDKLLPKKKSFARPFAAEITPTEYVVDGTQSPETSKNTLTYEAIESPTRSNERSYVPQESGLIKRVTIRTFDDKYDFYGSFRKAALVYYDYKTEKCEFAPFYSYMPQYSQLTQQQKNYYFYWRDCVRRGKYIKSDYSYLYLYVYEILNLPDKIAPESAVSLLCRLWREYRVDLPRIDAYFSAWLQDLCLVYGLACPMDEIRDFAFDAISVSAFKEFYFSDTDLSSDGGIDALLAYLSDYDWRRGKYSGGENRERYAEYMHGAMHRFLFHLREDGVMTSTTDIAVTRHDAFPHSLCTHAVKCKLEIEYVPLSRDEKARSLVSAGVRYTENKLRALFGIKSRLAVKDFPDKYKRTIDIYFDALIASERRRVEKENAPEYEKLYDAPKESLSFAGAAQIEMSSWSTTARLVVESEDIDDRCDDIVFAEPIYDEDRDIESDVDTYGLAEKDIKIVAEVLNSVIDLKDDTVAEKINNAFSDGFGDVILEFDGEKYVVIEDYEEEIREWLSKLMK